MQAGDYSVVARDEDGRYYTETVSITEPAAMSIFSNITPASCSSGSTDGAIMVSVNGAVAPVTYSWSNGATTKDLRGIPAGIYTVSTSDANGCSAGDSIEVPAMTTVTAYAGADTTVCPGTTLTLDGSGGTEINWTPAGELSNPALPNPVVTINSTVSYILTVKGMNECTDTDTITISVFPSGGLDAGRDTLLSGTEVTLNATGGPFLSYNWTPSVSLDDSTSASPVASPQITTMYEVRAITEDGCTELDTVTVAKAGRLFVYSAFSPNGDGVNDYWDIDNASEYPGIIVAVYSRWGEKLFSSRGYSDDKRWDGTYNGKPAPVGTYYFVIVPYNGAQAITGPLTIIR